MIETELKLTAPDAAVLQSVLESGVLPAVDVPADDNTALQYRARYYDTIDWALLKQRSSLRARWEDSRFVAALKMPGQMIQGLSSRQEYEAPIDDWLSTMHELPDSELKRQLCKLVQLDRKIVSRIEVDTERVIRNLRLDKSDVEMVFDTASIRANNRQQTLYEIELELKSGDLAPLLAFGGNLKKEFDLTFSKTTKHQIGLALFDE
ncbi:MAG: CYTH domain-containing protein [Pseudomonadota bacterium]